MAARLPLLLSRRVPLWPPCLLFSHVPFVQGTHFKLEWQHWWITGVLQMAHKSRIQAKKCTMTVNPLPRMSHILCIARSTLHGK